MPKWCREALRAIGFEEDRGACNVMECAGQFKYQHDTDKDLKFIHVFPRIDTAAAAAAAAADEDEEEEEVTIAGMKLDELPPEHLCTIVSVRFPLPPQSPLPLLHHARPNPQAFPSHLSCLSRSLPDNLPAQMETFGRLVAAQCPSFSQRRALLKAMKEMQARFTSFEERMTNMQQLSKDEDELYNSAQDLPEKIAQLEKQLEVGPQPQFPPPEATYPYDETFYYSLSLFPSSTNALHLLTRASFHSSIHPHIPAFTQCVLSTSPTFICRLTTCCPSPLSQGMMTGGHLTRSEMDNMIRDFSEKLVQVCSLLPPSFPPSICSDVCTRSHVSTVRIPH
jgi:hypothetical protein